MKVSYITQINKQTTQELNKLVSKPCIKHSLFFVDNGAVSKRGICLNSIHPLEMHENNSCKGLYKKFRCFNTYLQKNEAKMQFEWECSSLER